MDHDSNFSQEINILGYSDQDFANGLTVTQNETAHKKQWDLWRGLYDMGAAVVPCDREGKGALHAWKYMQDERPTLFQFSEWKKRYSTFGSCNLLWIMGDTEVTKLVCVDADDIEAIRVVESLCDPTPLTVQRCDHKRHYYYRHPCDEDVKTVAKIVLDGEVLNLDIRGDGGAAVAPYSFHKEGALYLPSQPITKELLESLPVYDPIWIPYSHSNGGKYSPSTSVTVPIDLDIDHETACSQDYGLTVDEREEQARYYLAGTKGCQQSEGKGADNRCLAITGGILIGFALPQHRAESLLCEWGERSDQKDANGGYYPWTAQNIRHKIKSCLSKREGYKGSYGDRVRLLSERTTWEDVDAYIVEECGGWWTPDREEEEEREARSTRDTLEGHPLYGYLWKGYHTRISNPDKMKRLKSIKATMQLMPNRGFFYEWMRLALPTTDAQPIYHLAAALGVAATLVNRKASIRFRVDRLHPNLWIGALGQSSSTRKSTAINMAKRYLSKIEGYANVLQGEASTWEGTIAEIGAILKPTNQGDDYSQLAEMGWAKHRQMERECLEKGVEFTKGVALFHFNEIASWLANLAKTTNGGVKEIFTDLYDPRDYWSKSTRTQGLYYLYKPTFSMLGGSTVDWLVAQTKEEDLKSGFFARWLFFNTSEKDYILPYPDEPDADQEEVVLEAMRSLANVRGEVSLSEEAFEHNWTWREKIEKEHTGDDVVSSWVSRLSVSALKIALLYEASTTDHLESISLASMQLATNLIDHLIVSLKATLQDIAYTDDGKEINAVIRRIKAAKKKGIVRSLLLKNSHLKANKLKEIIETLDQRGDIIIDEVPADNGAMVARFRWRS